MTELSWMVQNLLDKNYDDYSFKLGTKKINPIDKTKIFKNNLIHHRYLIIIL